MNEVEQIANQINLAYRDGFWGGGSIGELFRSFTASEAASYPISGAHSAWEIALHLSAWHNIFRSRIVKDGVEYHYETDWPTPAATTEANWTSALDDLDNAHKALVDAVRKVKVEDLNKLVSGKKFTIYEMLHGISQHDHYHAGQVMILKKAIMVKSVK
jgi:uncharacterized damage-inducible protein DinB